jgi:Zn-dependent protease
MNDMNSLLLNIAQSLPGFLLAIVAHEAAHAWVAYKFGDNTAYMQGRMTLNPAVHYDLFGTILFPLIAAATGFAMIGWAKPVPINSRNFKKLRSGLFWVSFAGPLANLLLGLGSAILYAVLVTQVSREWEFHSISQRVLGYSVFINFILAFFNLIPLPPLDGSKMVASFLKGPILMKYEEVGRFTPMLFIGILALSMMGIHTIGYVLAPAQTLANYLVYSLIGLFGGFA